MLTTYRRTLSPFGFEVITASHGFDALMQYQAHSGDFGTIILDEIPQLKNMEFIRTIQKMGFKGRIIIVSPNLRSEAAQLYKLYGISDYLQKPFKMNLLATMLLQQH